MLHFVLSILCLSSVATAIARTGPVPAGSNVSIHINPDSVDSLDVKAYMGLWYQMAADSVVITSFEKNSYCDTAFYGDNGDGTISVHNYATLDNPSGSAYTIDGYAYQTNPTAEPGQLNVVFQSDDAFPFPAPYWILELGPINADGLYDYAIVSDSFSLYLFVLARDVATYNAKYRSSVSKTLIKLGFTGLSAAIDTYQEADCVYEASRRAAVRSVVQLGSKPSTVDSLEISSYLGKIRALFASLLEQEHAHRSSNVFSGLWYQIAVDAAATVTQKNSFCDTAFYGDNGDGTISVHNYATLDSPSGTVYTIDGYGYQTNPKEPGQLNVVLQSADALPFPAPYWILELGPINADGLYDYAIVSDSFSLFLFVLARDVATYHAKYSSSVSKTLTDMGFTGIKAPIESYQKSDCVYESVRRVNGMKMNGTK